MSTQPQTEEYLAARRESCRLLGLNADDLTPHEMIRADLATVLRLWLDGSQSALLAGGNADPVKLLSVVEALTKLVPETEHKSRGADPRQVMWQNYLAARRRGEIAVAESTYEGALREVERLRGELAAFKSENEQLRAQLAGSVPLPPNVVPMPRPPSAPASSPPPFVNGLSDVPQHVRDTRPPNEAWRNFVKIDWQG
jgi:hypothetical protein